MTPIYVARALAVFCFIAAIVNGMAKHYEAAGLDMIACALFWRVEQGEES